MKTNYAFIVLFILTLFISCDENEKPCEGFEPQLNNLLIKVELIDATTQENLITNGTYNFAELSIDAQNGSSVDFLNGTDDILVLNFDYNNAEGVYLINNNEENLLEFKVNIKKIDAECYQYNEIESVEFPGHESAYDTDRQTYSIYL